MPLRKYNLRFIAVFLTLIFCLFVFAFKLVLIQVFNASHLAEIAEKQHNHLLELEPVRGSIYDRNMRPLAFNISVYSLYANPKMMTKDMKEKALKHLPSILQLDHAFVKERLGRDKYFIWIKRKLEKDVVDQVKALKIKGLNFINESKRYYPNDTLASHIIGFAGIDNQGLEGLELSYNNHLKGEKGRARILRDARQRDLMLEKDYLAPKDGHHLVLTIDETIQYIAEESLNQAYEKYKAKSGMIIVMDVQTGEILALANRPTYSLTNVHKSPLENRTNRVVSFIYEPGSVFKIVTAAAALEEDVFVETDRIFCENGEYRVANHILHDHRPHGDLSFREVFVVSSNIGVAKIAQKLSADTVYKYAKRFRFGKITGVDLLGEIGGTVKSPSRWSKTTISAFPMGHEVTTTPLQLVYALASIANNGIYMKPFIVKKIVDNKNAVIKEFNPQIVDRVISQSTAERVSTILTDVVNEGTARRAQIKDMKVAGKTGTAQKVVDGVYSHSDFYATFMGYAPADNPKLAAIVVLDEPRPQYFGGTVSAPVFKEVVEKSLRYLNVQ